jgi:hypothetical protein
MRQILDFESITKHAPNTPGIYKIYLCAPDGEPIELQRLLGKDSTGLIYIGASKSSVKERLLMFKRVTTDGYRANAHSGALKLNSIKTALEKVYGSFNLYFDCTSSPDSQHAMKKERDLLAIERAKNGETPVLNG